MNRVAPLALASFLAACGGGDNNNNTADLGRDASASTDAAISSSTDAAIATLSDTQSAQVVLSINQGEVKVANAVSGKLTNSGIASFANEMVTVHTQATTDANTLFSQQGISPEQNGVSMALDSAASTMATQLEGLAAPDKPYIDGQVAMHAQALVLVDCVLVPSVKNAAFASMLSTMRTTVADHLDMAKMLGGTASAPGPDAGVSDCSNVCTAASGLPDAVRAALCE